MNIEWIVESCDAHKSLLEFLQEKLQEKQFSRRKIKGFIDAGYCFIQRKSERFGKARLKAGAFVTLCIPKESKSELATIYEDDALLVINKSHSTTCDERLERKLGAFLVHRIDKDTTGVLLLAKTESFRDQLMLQFQERLVQKTYLALVEGRIEKKEGVIENYLGPVLRSQGRVKWGQVPNGHYAHTLWQVQTQSTKYSKVLLMPETGRTHQLRVHLSSIGHPIVGDHLYGSKTLNTTRYFLHSSSLSFLHPQKNEMVKFQAPIPQDMTQFGQKLCIF